MSNSISLHDKRKLLLDLKPYKSAREEYVRENKNMDKKNLGKIVLKTTLALSGPNFVKITEVFIPTWNMINPMVNPVASKEIESYIKDTIWALILLCIYDQLEQVELVLPLIWLRYNKEHPIL